jgi:hypothetical protein
LYVVTITANNLRETSFHFLVTQTAEIKQQVMMNTQLLQELVKRQRGLEMLKGGRPPDNMSLPLISYNELTKVENQLQNQDIYKQLVRNLI